MTREEKVNLLNELLEIEEKNDIGNLTSTDRREFQQWVEHFCKDIKQLPPVAPQPKIGKWIFEREWSDWFEETYKCSCCNRKIIVPGELSGEELYKEYPYCHCGAKMQEVKE